jgi:hypothetical protein
MVRMPYFVQKVNPPTRIFVKQLITFCLDKAKRSNGATYLARNGSADYAPIDRFTTSAIHTD